MTRHYSNPELLHMDVETLLASDPLIWETYRTIIEE
jgi:hypothetical protein